MMAMNESTSKMICKDGYASELIKAPPGLGAPPGLEKNAKSPKALSGGTHAAAGIPGILLELVTIVTQITNLDKMLDAVRNSAPSESSEAERWHQVSVQALEISRKALHEKQVTLLKSLTDATSAEPGNCGSVDMGTQHMETPKKALSECSTTMSASPSPECNTPNTVEEMECNFENQENAVDLSQSMAVHLEKLKEHPNGHSLIVRKIKQLGFQSPEILKEHFEQYGEVSEVMVAHSITKPSAKRTKGRVRPAAVGFVVMRSLEGAEAAFAAGEEQMVKVTSPGAVIGVARYQPNLL